MTTGPLDFRVYEEGAVLVIALSGRPGAGLGQQLLSMAPEGRRVVVDLQKVVSLGEDALLALLSFASRIRGTGGNVRLVAVTPAVQEALEPYRHLLGVHPTLASLLAETSARRWRWRSWQWTRRTGVRLHPGVAAVLAILWAGWMVTLLALAVWQERELGRARAHAVEIEQLHRAAADRAASLEARLGPLEDLGLLDPPRQRRPRLPSPFPPARDSPFPASSIPMAPGLMQLADSIPPDVPPKTPGAIQPLADTVP